MSLGLLSHGSAFNESKSMPIVRTSPRSCFSNACTGIEKNTISLARWPNRRNIRIRNLPYPSSMGMAWIFRLIHRTFVQLTLGGESECISSNEALGRTKFLVMLPQIYLSHGAALFLCIGRESRSVVIGRPPRDPPIATPTCTRWSYRFSAHCCNILSSQCLIPRRTPIIRTIIISLVEVVQISC